MDLHSGKPFERRGGDVIVFPYPQQGGIGIEAPENGVMDGRHGDLFIV
jgi:hypothetical protein